MSQRSRTVTRWKILAFSVLVLSLGISVFTVQKATRLRSRAATSNSSSLGLGITRSLVQTGESYGIWVTLDKVNNVLYTGNLEVAGRYCDDACTSGWKTFQQVWRDWNQIPLYVNGYAQVSIPASFPSRVTFLKVRPYPNPSGLDWSNEVQLNIRNLNWLENTRNYWVFWPTPKKFIGRNYVYNENFTTQVGYEPASNICGAGTGRAMSFVKSNVYGYWNPAVPWYNQLWTGSPNLEKNTAIFDSRFKRDLRWHVMDWTKKTGWNESFLSAYGHKEYAIQTSPPLSSFLRSMKYFTSSGATFPNYGLIPEWVGSGWTAGTNKAKNTAAVSNDMCSTPEGGTESIWSVRADFLPLSTKKGVVNALRIRYLEGDRAYLSGGNFLREDWWFVKNDGLIKIDVKYFGSTPSGYGRLPCLQDSDCVVNSTIINPHISMTREDY